MSNTRTAIAAALLLAALPLAAAAQSAPPPAPAAQPQHHGWMTALRSLSLTDAQRAQIKDLVKQTHAANKNADPDTKKANIQKLRSQIDAILTPDQRAQFASALKAQRKAG